MMFSLFKRNGRLSGRELRELGERLAQATDENLSDVPTLDGFLTAVVLSPEVIEQQECLAAIFGERWVQFRERADAARLYRLLGRHFNAIVAEWTGDRVKFAPLYEWDYRPDGEEVRVSGWCAGFMRGVGLRPRAWAPLTKRMKSDATSPLHPIWLLGTAAGWKRAQRRLSSDVEQSLAQHRRWREQVEEAVFVVRAYWCRRENNKLDREERKNAKTAIR